MYKVNSRNSMRNDCRTKEINGWQKPKSSDGIISHASNTGIDDLKEVLPTNLRCRLGLVTINLKSKDCLRLLGGVLTVIALIVFYNSLTEPSTTSPRRLIQASGESVYPLTKSLAIPNGKKYKIGIITDLDHNSKVKDSLWKSLYLKGYLVIHGGVEFDVQFDSAPIELYSSLGQGGRGMELSELVVFHGHVIAVDDRTGVLYKIMESNAVPWVILSDGPGNSTKGFKCEWASVKDGYLYVGGLGKEWTSTTGEVVNLHPQYVKRVSPEGAVEHLDWHSHYNAMRKKAGFSSPGYMIHESGVWSNVHRRWYFLPRRASTKVYDDKLDERRATNILITCDETFADIQVVQPFGPPSETHGFSSFKFIPATSDRYILALKSEEDNGKIASYIMVLDLKGNMIMREKQIFGSYKYEGVEFV
ncbi:apyrase apy-1-like [Watersipora subatra]|uniref:apyrase apy-1-like n=1 Tax=Watersipora subatra TaxID=2589382 RepID=UPI00355C5732